MTDCTQGNIAGLGGGFPEMGEVMGGGGGDSRNTRWIKRREQGGWIGKRGKVYD